MPRRRVVRTSALVLLLTLGLGLLAGCAAGPNEMVTGEADAGFLLGLWHGVIAPVTFVISLFTDNVNVYEVENNGNWYDFGFVIGVSTAFGGGAAGGARAR